MVWMNYRLCCLYYPAETLGRDVAITQTFGKFFRRKTTTECSNSCLFIQQLVVEMRVYLSRCTESSGVLLLIFAIVFINSCDCVIEDDVVLEKKYLSELYNKGLFIMENTQLKRCISSSSSNLVLESCERPTRRMLWKWVSRHRLFNLGSSLCLGLNISDSTQPLGTFECDSPLRTLWWRCNGNTLYGASQLKLSVAGRLVVVKRASYHQWRRYSTPGEGPCAYPYEEIHTLLGNAHGMPCALPFKYNNKWYSECTAEGREDHHRWCATTSRYDQDEKWGFCPSQELSCDTFWDSNQESRACYQFNLYTILTWSQAHSSCLAQGGSLLSITDLTEQMYIRERLADVGVMVWIGLNHLSERTGWQWSDGAPLALVNFTSGKRLGQCGVYNSASGGHQWQSLSCESALPYICKKTPNDTRRAEPLDNWQYYRTVCSEGWLAHNRYCYKALAEAEAGSWEDSSTACNSIGANLTSLHSLSDVELLLGLLANGESGSGVLYSTVEWSDGSPVDLTLWHVHHPAHSNSQLCAKTDLTVQSTESFSRMTTDWKRKGRSCYMVTSHEQSYEDAVKGYYCKAPLVTVENRFEQAFLNSLVSEMGANGSVFYWTALQDQGNQGEYSWLGGHNGSTLPLLYTNWNRHQPVSAGGCVAMTGGQALGHWEVKDCKSQKALSVCKQSISGYQEVLFPTVHIDAYAPCPPGWESHSGLLHCYKAFHSEKVLMKRSWEDADFFCQALGAQLASFHHYKEQVFVKGLLHSMFDGTEGRWFWVGLNKRDPQSAGAWEWSDGTPVVSSFVEDKNEEDDRHSCAVYSDLTNALLPQPCDTKHEWICKAPREKKPHEFHVNPPFLFFSWFSQLSLGSTDWWIGLSTDLVREEFSWSDKSAVDYQNWAEGSSHDAPVKQKQCVTMSSISGQWSAGECGGLHAHVCKRRTVSVVEIPREPHYIGGCPERWLYFGHKVHLISRVFIVLLFPFYLSWRDAQSICSSFQGTLVAIQDEIEQAYITMLLQGSTVGVWIGLRDEDTMKWTNGKPVSYTNWSPVEPKNPLTVSGPLGGDDPLCTVLSNNHNFHLTGKWFDEKCTESGYGFVCQRPQDTTKPPSHSYLHPLPDNIEYKNHRYRVARGNMSWYEALNMCLESESELVSVTDPFHQAFLTVLVNRLAFPHWIGLYSQDDGINYQWSDGSDTVFTHWVAADDDDFILGDCVYMDVTGGWRRADCEMPLQGALCHVPPPSEYSLANTSEVLTIQTETENRFVLEQLWSYGFPHQAVWLGMFFNTDTGSMAWLDGPPVDYSNWNFRAPDPSLLTADTCVSSRVSDGMWLLSQCTDRLGFVCKTNPGLHHGIVPAAVLVAMLIFAVLVAALWFVYKRNVTRFRRLPSLGNAYYRHTSSQATDSDGNVLIADLEAHSGE
uniref:Phospholipase A2 receptor 1 n=1 Tax=Oncorhynchus tshawytscha TaxID=74940 RepID=A0AAZ3SSB5_ONCTS